MSRRWIPKILGIVALIPFCAFLRYVLKIYRNDVASTFEDLTAMPGVLILIATMVAGIGIFRGSEAIRRVTLFFGFISLGLRLVIEIFATWDVTYWSNSTTLWFTFILAYLIILLLPPVASCFSVSGESGSPDRDQDQENKT